MFDGILGVIIIVISFILGLTALIYFGVVILGFLGVCALVVVVVSIIDLIDDIGYALNKFIKMIDEFINKCKIKIQTKIRQKKARRKLDAIKNK